MRSLYSTLKYLAIALWTAFVVGPFLWALSTSFKDFSSVTSGAKYIPWLQFEPTLEGWKVLWRARPPCSSPLPGWCRSTAAP